MQQLRKRNHKTVSILSGILIATFTLAILNMLTHSSKFADILVGATGLVLFLTQIIIALTTYRKHYKNDERPVLNPRILKYRTEYGKLRFILLTDTVNTRLSSIVVFMMIFYNQPFDLSWCLFLATLLILIFTKIFIGTIFWERYGEYVSNKGVTIDQY